MLSLKQDKTIFIAFIIGAFVLSYIPIIHWPFAWLETFFHEISHGFAALLSGGDVDRIKLFFSGAGRCYTLGGWAAFISFSGYLGASLWGAVIYFGARSSGQNNQWLAMLIAGFIVICGLLWARDIITIIILLVITGTLYISFRYVRGNTLPRFMEFVGVYIMLNAFRAPLQLIDGRHYGDGATLADLTFLPEIIWVGIWWIIAASVMAGIWKIHAKVVTE